MKRSPASSKRRRTGALALCLTASLLVACSSGDDDGGQSAGSTTTTVGSEVADPRAGGIGVDGVDEWETLDPSDLGLDSAVLDEIAEAAEADGSTCLLVARHGRIAGEWYWGSGAADEPREIFSATKSLASILVGIAADRGDLSVEDPASSYIAEWDGTDSADVTIENLLSNDSGRFWSMTSDYVTLVQSSNRTEYAVGLEQAEEPGSVWAYNNAAIQSLSAVLATATGEDVADFADEALFEPLGMADTTLSPDGEHGALTFMGAGSTCRDLARFGQMILLDGTWNDRQVVSAEYLESAVGRSSQDLNAAYGWLFWLNRTGNLAGAVDPTSGTENEGQEGGQLVPDRPEDLVWALGLGGQMVQVHEPTDTIVVRLGPANLRHEFTTEDTARVLDAVED